MRAIVVGVMLVLSIGSSAVLAQEPSGISVTEVQEVLETSQIEDVLGSLGHQVQTALLEAAPSLSEEMHERISSGVSEAFASDALYHEMVAAFRARSTPGKLAEVREWLLSEWHAEVLSKSDQAPLEGSLEEYAARIQTSPPPQARIQLVARYVEAQQAAEFYALLTERLRTSARRIAGEATGDVVLAPDERSEEGRAAELQQHFMFAIVSFLRRLEPLSDDEVLQLVEAYESPSGQWYVETYTQALLSVIDGGTDRTLARIRP